MAATVRQDVQSERTEAEWKYTMCVIVFAAASGVASLWCLKSRFALLDYFVFGLRTFKWTENAATKQSYMDGRCRNEPELLFLWSKLWKRSQCSSMVAKLHPVWALCASFARYIAGYVQHTRGYLGYKFSPASNIRPRIIRLILLTGHQCKVQPACSSSLSPTFGYPALPLGEGPTHD